MAKAQRPPSQSGRGPSILGLVGDRMSREWRAGPIHRLSIAGPRPAGLAAHPRDARPAEPERGAELIAGVFRFGGEAMEVGAGGDPWRRAAPSRRFAAWLHGFAWMRDLLGQGEPGAREALRLWFEWRRLFGRYNDFAWSGPALERRVFNLACAAPALSPLASEAEGASLVADLARQARHLNSEPGDPARAVERAAAASLAGAALAGRAGERLMARALSRLAAALPQAVLRDGVHASRSPERGLELSLDLMALDDALSQRGWPAPVEVSRAIDRLGAGVSFFTMTDARLAAFHGGESGSRRRIAAALALEAAADPPAKAAPYGGFHRIEGRGLALMVDAAAPAARPWDADACAQLAAIAVAANGRTLVVGSVWSAKGQADSALRGPAGGSCVGVGEAWPAPRLVTAERQETGEAVWLEVTHDGWRALGLSHTRRLFLDLVAGELRGEDALVRVGRARSRPPVEVRFQLAAEVAASIAANGRSALLRPAGGAAWRLRSDAARMRLAPGVAFEDGAPHATQALVLEDQVGRDEGARIRWKLSRGEA